MRHIFDEGDARATVLRFGRLSSELLAWGAADGSVRVATLADPPRVLHARPAISTLAAPLPALARVDIWPCLLEQAVCSARTALAACACSPNSSGRCMSAPLPAMLCNAGVLCMPLLAASSCSRLTAAAGPRRVTV